MATAVSIHSIEMNRNHNSSTDFANALQLYVVSVRGTYSLLRGPAQRTARKTLRRLVQIQRPAEN